MTISSPRRSIQQNHFIGFLKDPVLVQAFDDYRGLFRARVFFWDGSHLTVDEIVDTQTGYPEILRYAYTYVRDGQLVFRYDNAPHYPEFETFPHHKHIGLGEVPQASRQPKLSQVFVEIGQILTTE